MEGQKARHLKNTLISDHRGRLARRLLFWVIAISSFFALLTTCFQLYISFDEDKDGILANLEFIKKSYAPSIASSSYALEEETVHLLMQGVLSIQDITHVEVWEGESKWLVMGDPESSDDFVREYPLKYTDRWGNTVNFGHLKVTASLVGVYKRLWRRAFVLLGTNIIKTVFTSLCIFFLFQWMVTRHLSTIANYSRQIDLDSLGAALKLERKGVKPDEFDDLTNSINEMRSRLVLATAEQKRLIRIIENTTDMISIATPDGMIKYLNTAGMNLLGWGEGGEGYRGKKIADAHPPWATELINNTAIPCAIQDGVWTGKTALLNRDGIEIPASQVITAHRSPDGELEYFSTIIRDISDIQRAEEELQKAHRELEQRVEERTLELKETHSQLLHAEKLTAVGRLSASIAHEFNNPLQGVMSVISGIKKRATLDDADVKLVDMALRECNRMKNFIKDLQDFNRPTSARLAPANIHEIIDSTLLLAKKDLESRNISLEKDYAQDIPWLKVVSDQMKQVFLNLFNNAADACESGGIIRISTRKEEENIVIRVKDTGKGIAPEHLNHIFEPFFTTKDEVKGTGLGLSVSYGIIKNHGGTITVESKQEKGTTFTITLPIKGGSRVEKIDTTR